MTDYTSQRNRHDRLEQHYGTLTADLVELSAALGTTPTGGTIEDVIRQLHERLARLESTDIAFSSFLADAYLVRTVTGTLTADAKFLKPYPLPADAIIKKTMLGSLLAGGVMRSAGTGMFLADAIVRASRGDTFKADAEMITSGTISASLLADAVLSRVMAGSFVADANISSGTDEPSSTLGEMTLGASTLGG